jgi:hypothetical protein
VLACAGYLTHPPVFWGFKQKFLPTFISLQTFSVHWDALMISFDQMHHSQVSEYDVTSQLDDR